MRFRSINYREQNVTFNEMGLKVETVYISDPSQYGRHAVYVNRIANFANPKFRVIATDREHVKNCLKVTYNPDRWTKEQVERLIRSRSVLLSRYSCGTCQKFIRHREMKDALTAIIVP